MAENYTPEQVEAMTGERGWLASYLDDGGWHTEAENVRKGLDLDSYENELRLIDWLRRHTHLAQPAQAVDVGDGSLWSFLRSAMQQGIDIYRDHEDKPYEAFSARLDAAASERVYQFRALSGEKAGPVGDGAVAWQIRAGRGRNWEACTRECYDDTLRTGRYMGLPAGTTDVEVRALYAEPPSARVTFNEIAQECHEEWDRLMDGANPASPTPDKEGQP